MNLYYGIRIVLAIGILFLLRKNLPDSLRLYCEFMAVFMALPQFLQSGEYWRYVWFPLSIVEMSLGWAVCVDLFEFQTRDRTHWDERIMVRGFGACLGLAFVLLTWYWRPENSFQAWTLIHQYYRIALCGGWLAVSAWFGWLRPLVRRDSDIFLYFWTLWLVCQAVMGATAKAGLIWSIIPPSGFNYRVVNDTAMMIQFFSVLYLLLKGKDNARRQPHAGYQS